VNFSFCHKSRPWRRRVSAGVTEVAQLRGLRVARRQFGTGTRVLLDRLLADAGIPAASVAGPEAASHLDVAGQADAGIGVRAAATALDLGFSRVTWEDFDIVLSADALEAAEPLIAALRQPSVRSAVEALGGYDTCQAGSVEYAARRRQPPPGRLILRPAAAAADHRLAEMARG
jgi:molybdate-binding protein